MEEPIAAIIILRQAVPSLKMAVEGLCSPIAVQANHMLSRCRTEKLALMRVLNYPRRRLKHD